MVDVVFTHWGLATTSLVHAVLTLITGVALLVARHGYPPSGRWLSVVRVAHTVLGVLLVLYLAGTYVVVPV